ncbi:FAD:protein FMN transferase [Granulicella aggregans]|uniref:FAD:protein FMN transferase n=1 Tax=Granulicella aggregans TaxID=474949 RepID=UPI001FE4F0D3|nr:FAD:protein FMN transferase [Granulicella aggregans]
MTCFAAFALTLGQVFVAAQTPPAATRFHLSHAAMGTEFTIDLYAKDQSTAEQQANVAFDEIDRLEDLLSNYRPSSELSRISRDAGNGPVVTDPETFQFLERSLFWSQRSSGAFDITVGPLLRVWGFYQHGGRVPLDTELKSLRDSIGSEKITLDEEHRSVSFKNHHAMDLDPGSIGKGFAVDAAVRLLREAGVQSALISAGGSTLYAIGAPPGESGWIVKVEDPRSTGITAATVLLKDTSLSSGACTQKFFIKDGHRYCHIFNPQTLRPMEGVLQSTVISPSATDSDALSTVVFVLPPEASRQLLTSMPNTEALLFRGPTPVSDCIAINWQGQPCSPNHSSSKSPSQEKGN